MPDPKPAKRMWERKGFQFLFLLAALGLPALFFLVSRFRSPVLVLSLGSLWTVLFLASAIFPRPLGHILASLGFLVLAILHVLLGILGVHVFFNEKEGFVNEFYNPRLFLTEQNLILILLGSVVWSFFQVILCFLVGRACLRQKKAGRPGKEEAGEKEGEESGDGQAKAEPKPRRPFLSRPGWKILFLLSSHLAPVLVLILMEWPPLNAPLLLIVSCLAVLALALEMFDPGSIYLFWLLAKIPWLKLLAIFHGLGGVLAGCVLLDPEGFLPSIKDSSRIRWLVVLIYSAILVWCWAHVAILYLMAESGKRKRSQGLES